MREYGRVSTQFWTDAKVQRLSDRARLMMIYLLTGPHTNCVGCFRLPSGYIEADFGWNEATVTQTLAELLREGLVVRENDRIGWTWIVHFLKHNPIENPNVGKSAMSFISAIPSDIGFFSKFISALEPFCERFPSNYLRGLANGMPNKEPDPFPEPEPDSFALEPVDVSSDHALAEIDIDAAVHVWNDLASELGLARVQKLTDARKSKLRARLRDTGGIAGWAAVLVKIRESHFLCGQGKNGWRADFDFVLQETSFNKLIEGAYSDKRACEVRTVETAFKLPPPLVAALRSASFTDNEIKRWFDDAAFTDDTTSILVGSTFVRDWIRSHYEAKLVRAFGQMPEVEVAGPSFRPEPKEAPHG